MQAGCPRPAFPWASARSTRNRGRVAQSRPSSMSPGNVQPGNASRRGAPFSERHIDRHAMRRRMPEIRQENGTGVAPTPDGGSSMTDISRCIVLDAPFEASVTATLEAFRAEGFDLASTLDLREYL